MDTTDQQEKHAVISDICSDDDARELANLGKKPVLRVCITSLLLGSLEAFDLQLQRNFSLIAILGLSCTLMVTWEGLFSVFVFGLQNGGPAGLIYGFLFVWIGCQHVADSRVSPLHGSAALLSGNTGALS
jgi:choline transport protein